LTRCIGIFPPLLPVETVQDRGQLCANAVPNNWAGLACESRKPDDADTSTEPIKEESKAYAAATAFSGVARGLREEVQLNPKR
jgi:hypothetical protein